MPLDSSIYPLGLLRVDGRRWNEIRQISAQLRTQPGADGSSYLEIGHSKVMSVVTGPSESQHQTQKRTGAASLPACATILVNIVLAGFSSGDVRRRGRMDKRLQEMETIVAKTMCATLHTHLFPRSVISIALHVLSQDGSLLAALINASTLALIDAGIPMADYVAACTAGSTLAQSAGDDTMDPLLDLNSQEEMELPLMTVATFGSSDKVLTMVSDSRIVVNRLEEMLAVGVDGCKQVQQVLNRIVRDAAASTRREFKIGASIDEN